MRGSRYFFINIITNKKINFIAFLKLTIFCFKIKFNPIIESKKTLDF